MNIHDSRTVDKCGRHVEQVQSSAVFSRRQHVEKGEAQWSTRVGDVQKSSTAAVTSSRSPADDGGRSAASWDC